MGWDEFHSGDSGGAHGGDLDDAVVQHFEHGAEFVGQVVNGWHRVQPGGAGLWMCLQLLDLVEGAVGGILEKLAGAVITGTQVTRTFPNVQILPSEHSARFTVLLNGVSDSSTTAKKRPATIFGKCHSEFIARKQIELTEAGLLVAEPTEVEVLKAKMEYTGAEVDVAGFLKKIARKTALRKAAEKRPAAEALTRKRLQERVSAQLDHEVNTTLKQVNERYYWLWRSMR